MQPLAVVLVNGPHSLIRPITRPITPTLLVAMVIAMGNLIQVCCRKSRLHCTCIIITYNNYIFLIFSCHSVYIHDYILNVSIFYACN